MNLREEEKKKIFRQLGSRGLNFLLDRYARKEEIDIEIIQKIETEIQLKAYMTKAKITVIKRVIYLIALLYAPAEIIMKIINFLIVD